MPSFIGKGIVLIIILVIGIYYSLKPEHIDRKTFHASNKQKETIRITNKTHPISEHYIVDYVIDGDTIKLSSGDIVRYIGINTPEIKDFRNSVQCFAKEAKLKNKNLLSNKPIRLEKDISDRDKYNRLLRYVYLTATGTEDIFLNLELVKEGYAYASSYPPDIKYQKLFYQAQIEAKSSKRGLWNKCQ